MGDAPILVCIGNLTVDEAVSARRLSASNPSAGDALYAALAARLAGADLAPAPIGTDAPPLCSTRSGGRHRSRDAARREMPTVRNVVTYDEAGGRHWDLVHGEDALRRDVRPPGRRRRRALAAHGILVSAMSLHAQLELAPWLRRAPPPRSTSTCRRTSSSATRPSCSTRSGRATCSCRARSRRSHWPARPTCATRTGSSASSARRPS